MPTMPLAPIALAELRLRPPRALQSAGTVKAVSPMSCTGMTDELSPPIDTVARLREPQVKPEANVAHWATGALPVGSSVAPVCAGNCAAKSELTALAMTRTPLEPVSRIMRSIVAHGLLPCAFGAHSVMVTYG